MNICPYCDIPNNDIEKRRLNTLYVEEERNFMTSCRKCYDRAYAEYQELWDDYYSNCMQQLNGIVKGWI